MLRFVNLHKITIIFRNVKPTFVESLKLSWHGFYKTITNYKKEAKVRKDRRHLLITNYKKEAKVRKDRRHLLLL